MTHDTVGVRWVGTLAKYGLSVLAGEPTARWNPLYSACEEAKAMAPARKTFTRDEANALIPYLQHTVDTLQQQIKEVVRLKRQLEILNLICDSPVSPQNLDFQEYLQKTALYHQLVGQADGLIKEVRGKGCLLRDLHAGIVDFYAEMGGRVVFLCWRRGEGEITHWHPVDQGYGQRRTIAGSGS